MHPRNWVESCAHWSAHADHFAYRCTTFNAGATLCGRPARADAQAQLAAWVVGPEVPLRANRQPGLSVPAVQPRVPHMVQSGEQQPRAKPRQQSDHHRNLRTAGVAHNPPAPEPSSSASHNDLTFLSSTLDLATPGWPPLRSMRIGAGRANCQVREKPPPRALPPFNRIKTGQRHSP